LELGASAGLNLLADRYCYVTAGGELGDRDSPVRFLQPWAPPPTIDLAAANGALRIAARAGCDLAPLDPADPDDRMTLLSYIWPDELERINRTKAALHIASNAPATVARERAREWLAHALAAARAEELIVIWHSLFRQYVGAEEWDELQRIFGRAIEAHPEARIVWLSMEPSCDHIAKLHLAVRTHPAEAEHVLARCDDHGMPISWLALPGHGNAPVEGDPHLMASVDSALTRHVS
jgi:hypothetical protein